MRLASISARSSYFNRETKGTDDLIADKNKDFKWTYVMRLKVRVVKYEKRVGNEFKNLRQTECWVMLRDVAFLFLIR